MDVSSLQAQAQRRERPCPSPLGERVRHGRPGEVPLDILPERGWKLLPRNPVRRTPVGWHRNGPQPSGLMQPYKGVPRLRDGAGQVAKIPDQGRRFQFGDEAGDRAVVDGLWRDPAQARPSGETRKALADPLVGRRKKPAPGLIEVEVGGLEHRPQAGGLDGGGEVAAQVRPPLGRYLGPGRHHAVEGPADVGKIERDGRRWLAPELGEAGDRRAQVALAASPRGRHGGKPIEHGLQRRRGGGLGKGIGLHRLALS